MLIEKRQLLLIDDESNKCEIFLLALEKISFMYNCSFVNSNSNPAKLIKKIMPDFIFFNMSKPNPDELLPVEAIKKVKSIRHIPFFIYASHLDEATSVKAVELGVSMCIKKPKDARTLTKILKKLFYQKMRAEIRNYAPRKKSE